MTLTQNIQEIKERLYSTTPGVWQARFAEDEQFRPDCPEEDPCIQTDSGQFIAIVTYDQLSHTCRPTMYDDARFIAHAKEDIAFLIEQLEVFLNK